MGRCSRSFSSALLESWIVLERMRSWPVVYKSRDLRDESHQLQYCLRMTRWQLLGNFHTLILSLSFRTTHRLAGNRSYPRGLTIEQLIIFLPSSLYLTQKSEPSSQCGADGRLSAAFQDFHLSLHDRTSELSNLRGPFQLAQS